MDVDDGQNISAGCNLCVRLPIQLRQTVPVHVIVRLDVHCFPQTRPWLGLLPLLRGF